MLGNILALYKARNDPNLAKTIATEMVVDGTIERIGWPLLIAKFWMSLGLLLLCLLFALCLWLTGISYWVFAIPALFFGGGIYLIIRIWRGLNRGVEKISYMAKTELNQRVQAVGFPSKRADREETPKN